MLLEIKGTLIYLSAEQVSKNGDFKHKEALIQTDEEYPQTYPIRLDMKNISDLDTVALGTDIHIKCVMKGKGYDENRKAFLSLKFLKLVNMPTAEPVVNNTETAGTKEQLPF